jgi:hypothetical protein
MPAADPARRPQRVLFGSLRARMGAEGAMTWRRYDPAAIADHAPKAVLRSADGLTVEVMPSVNTSVLILVSDGRRVDVANAQIVNGYLMTLWVDGETIDYAPTHWMPLPDPPRVSIFESFGVAPEPKVSGRARLTTPSAALFDYDAMMARDRERRKLIRRMRRDDPTWGVRMDPPRSAR